MSRELISGGVGLTQASEQAARHRGRLGERLAWGVAAVCIALLAWLGVAHWRSTRTAESRHLRLSLLPPPSTSFVPYNFAISPDGRRLAFVAVAQDGSTALWIRPLAADAAQQLTGTEGATWPFWSPDSRQVGFFQASKLKSVDPSSGACRSCATHPAATAGHGDAARSSLLDIRWATGSAATSEFLRCRPRVGNGRREPSRRATRRFGRPFFRMETTLYFSVPGTRSPLRSRESMSGHSVQAN